MSSHSGPLSTMRHTPPTNWYGSMLFHCCHFQLKRKTEPGKKSSCPHAYLFKQNYWYFSRFYYRLVKEVKMSNKTMQTQIKPVREGLFNYPRRWAIPFINVWYPRDGYETGVHRRGHEGGREGGKSIAQYAGLLHLKSVEEIPLAQTDI